MKNLTITITLCAIGIFVCCCFGGCGDINKDELPPYDKDGVILDSVFKSFYTREMPEKAMLYVETSGSMNGLFRKGASTGFKSDISTILLNRQIKPIISSVNVFVDNSGEQVRGYTPEAFRTKMNNGDFVSQQSTIIPKMLEKILSDIDAGACDVAVLISDMKYSPVGKNHQIAMDQYETEIKSMFDGVQYSVSLIGCESEYIAINGKSHCDEFPYYFVIIGDTKKTAWMRNKVMNALESVEATKGHIKGCMDFNIDYGCPRYTALPNQSIGVVQNTSELMSPIVDMHSSSFTTFDDSAQPVTIKLAVNYRHIPLDLVNALSHSDFILSSYMGDMNAEISGIEPIPDNYKCQHQSLIDYVQPNVLIKVNLTGLDTYKSDVISIKLNTLKQSTDWVEKYYGAELESELDKTLSIDALVKGLSSAYDSYNLQNSAMTLFITTEANK